LQWIAEMRAAGSRDAFTVYVWMQRRKCGRNLQYVATTARKLHHIKHLFRQAAEFDCASIFLDHVSGFRAYLAEQQGATLAHTPALAPLVLVFQDQMRRRSALGPTGRETSIADSASGCQVRM
jgi:hypothetical protein